MRKRTKLLVIAAVLVLILGIAGGVAAGNYLYNLAIDPHADKSAVFNAPKNQIKSTAPTKPTSAQPVQEWAKTITYQESDIRSLDGLRLHAYTIENKIKSDKWAILVHGYGSQGLYMAEQARSFYEMGYNILMPDLRGHGKSEGDYIGMGWDDRRDIIRWSQEIIKQHPESQIVLYGISMGGAAVMMAAGEKLPPQIKAVVEDCGYSSVNDEFAYQLKALFHIPAFPVLDFASAVTKVRAGYSFGQADAVKQLRKAEVPILFIHGDADTFVPFSMQDKVYQAAAGPKEKYVVAGAGHSMAAAVAGEAYWDRVGVFLDQYIK